MCQKDAGRMANIVDLDQTAASFRSSPIFIFALFPLTCLSENLLSYATKHW